MYNVSKYFMIASAIFSLICCGGAVWAGIKLNNDSTCYFMALIFLVAFVWLALSIKKMGSSD